MELRNICVTDKSSVTYEIDAIRLVQRRVQISVYRQLVRFNADFYKTNMQYIVNIFSKCNTWWSKNSPFPEKLDYFFFKTRSPSAKLQRR